jgi:cell division septation protein DedD
MAGTVAAVVIFLCGLMVGRNLRSPRTEVAATTTETTVTDPTRPNDQALPPPTASSTESGTPVTAQETLTYSNRLEAQTPPEETLRSPGEAPPAEKTQPARPETKPAPARADDKAPAKPDPKPDPKPAPADAKTTVPEPAGNGFAVQVAAVKTRAEADAIAGRLKSKGYPAFVAQGTAAAAFRVRVGKYPDKRQADAVAARLQKEEQFKPWITR